MKKPLYLSDILAAKSLAAAEEAMQQAKQEAKLAKFKVPANLDPAIGTLMTAKGLKFYAFINGQYTEGSAEALAAALIA